MTANRTTDDIHVTTELPHPEEQPIHFVDVHIYDYVPEPAEAGLPPVVESPPEPTRSSENNQPSIPVHPSHRTRTTLLILSSALLCVLAGTALMIVSPLLWPSDATVTILASTQALRLTARIPVTTGPAKGAQLPGRALAAITMNEARTVPTTGTGHQDARSAQGFITFYNGAPSPQMVSAGTLLTGTDGVQVVTEQDALIPAVNYPTLGHTTVTAHAILTGPAGNIAGGDIYGPCCRLNVSAVNSAFIGGTVAREYPTVTQQDISSVVSGLTTSLHQSAQAALQTQVQSDETLITPAPCHEGVKPDHAPGEEAAQVTVTVSETCSGLTYQTQALHSLLLDRLTQQAHTRLGEGYSMQGDLHTSVNQVIPGTHGQMVLSVICAGTWAYQFTEQEQAQLKAAIRGKSRAEALTILLHTPGVQTVSLESEHLPTDVSHLHLVFLVIPA